MRGRDLDEWTGRLEKREKELADRESAISEEVRPLRTPPASGSTSARSASRRPRRTSASASASSTTARRSSSGARLATRRTIEIRLEKLEAREKALAELEEKLGTKENQLAAYVAQAQGALQRRESEWWNKQLGRRRRQRRRIAGVAVDTSGV